MTTAAMRRSAVPASAAEAARGWRVPHYLALAGVLLLVLQAWTVGAWLADGPQPVTQYRDSGHTMTWWAARVFEGLSISCLLIVGTVVIRRCLRERRLSFDAKLMLAGASVYWLDPVPNFFQPLWFYSTHFVNLNSWTGHIPGVVNPDAGRFPEAVLFMGPLYPGAVVAFAMLINALMRAAKRRWPSLSGAQVALVALGGGLVLDIVLELALYRLHLIANSGIPRFLTLFPGASFRYSLLEAFWGGAVLWVLALLRWYKDDRGHTYVERGLTRHSPRARAAISVLATIAIANVAMIAVDMGSAFMGNYAAKYPKYPAHLVNGMCDVEGQPATRYGPCPGSTNFRAPVRNLPGEPLR